MLFKNEETGHVVCVTLNDDEEANQFVWNPMDDLTWSDEVRLWSWDSDWCPEGAESLDERDVAESLHPDKDWQDVPVTWEDYLEYARRETGLEDVEFIYIYEHGGIRIYTGRPGDRHDRWDTRCAGIVAVSPDYGMTAKELIESYNEWLNLPVWEIINYDDPYGETLYGLGWTEEQALEYACVGPGYELVSEDWLCSHCEECDLGRC